MKIRNALLAAVAAIGAITTLHAAEETPAYPLKTCVVSGEGLTEMGKPYVFTYEGQEVQLCCKSCKKDFDKDPATYMKKIEAAKSGGTSTSAAPSAHQH
ncbi:MAG: hypothetical protein IAE94_06440 [Chthoniobacterales bacterium]|nr:hypothetical protein [Chthoniobacterales bacterium]